MARFFITLIYEASAVNTSPARLTITSNELTVLTFFVNFDQTCSRPGGIWDIWPGMFTL